MINQEIAEIFDRMARALSFKGKDRFRALAYERAAGGLARFIDVARNEDLHRKFSRKETATQLLCLPAGAAISLEGED
jgi:DNA polymerase/3'-5' exonuclease PolX